MPRPRRKQRRNKRSSPPSEPLPDSFLIIDSDNSSVPSSIADDYIANLLDQSDTELVDLPTPSNCPRKTSSPKSRSTSSSCSSSSDSPSPSRKPKPQPRKVVLEDAMDAFNKFSQRNNGQTTHACRPSPDSRHRLALHRSAELLGATSSSMGDGKERQVIIKWPTGKRVPISEAAFERGVTRILDELIPEKRERRGGGRERQRQLARQVRLARIWNDGDDVGDVEEVPDNDDKTEKQNVGDAEKVGRGNVGFDMLEKMGWSEGTGLGADRDGRVDPIIGQRRMRRAGLGSI